MSPSGPTRERCCSSSSTPAAEPIEAIRKGRLKETEDALIAATAEWDGLLLVTEDGRLRRALERRGTRVCGWVQLRHGHDIERLAEEAGA